MTFIAIKDEPANPHAAARAKQISRAVRVRSAARFDAACTASGIPHVRLAAHVGIDPKILREIRDGLRPLTGERIEEMPADVRKAYAASLGADAEDETPRSVAPLTVQAIRATSASARLAETVVEAVADSVIDDAEIDRIEREAARGERMHLLVRLSAGALRKVVVR